MHLGAIINTREDNIGVELYLADESANAYFEQLEQDREIIDAEVDFELVWMPLPERRACRIIGYHPLADLADKTSWPELQTWMINALEQMHTTFGSRVRNLSSEISL